MLYFYVKTKAKKNTFLRLQGAFRENWLIFLGIWEEVEIILRIWGARKILSGSLGILFRGFGEIIALFSGIKRAQTLPGGRN